jgi:hypothetical protein
VLSCSSAFTLKSAKKSLAKFKMMNLIWRPVKSFISAALGLLPWPWPSICCWRYRTKSTVLLFNHTYLFIF